MISAADQKLYSVAKPVETHTRPAKCEEVDCAAQAGGFVVNVDESTELGQMQAFYIRQQAGRAHTESKLVGLTAFTFPPGEQCFAGHRISLERPEWYSVTERGRRYDHTGPDPWLDDFGTHSDSLKPHFG